MGHALCPLHVQAHFRAPINSEENQYSRGTVLSLRCASILVAGVAAGVALAAAAAPAQSKQDMPAAVAAHTTLEQAPLPAIAPAGRPSIGLALEGAGALGLAHIGIIQWFEEHHIPVDRLAGTSMGALVGSMYAAGRTPAEMHALAISDAFSRVFTVQTPYVDSSFRRRQDSRENPATLTVGVAHGLELQNSLLTDRGVSDFLDTNLLGYNRTELDFNRMPIPFRCVATDLTTLRPVTFSSGPLPEAVLPSISIPGLFPPVKSSNGHYLVDGGIVDDLPADVVRNDLHADVVIAIRLEDAPLLIGDVTSLVGVLNRAFSAGIVQNVNLSVKLADVVVLVPVGQSTISDYTKGEALIDAGYKAAEANRDKLLPYALDDQGWAAYLAARNSRRVREPGILREVRVAGGDHGAQQQVQADMKPLEGQPVSAVKTLTALKPVQSNGVYSATFQAFALPPATPEAAAPQAGDSNAGTNTAGEGILVHLSKGHSGPPYLLISPDVSSETSNITRFELDMRLIDQDLGGYGSELRANANVGYMTTLNAEYYRLLSPNGFFLQPSAGLLRTPVYIWADQKRVAERLEQNLDTGLEVGRTVGNKLQISASWRAQDTHWSLTTGSGGGPYISGTSQQGLLHLNIDRETSGAVSPSGFRLNAAAGALYHAVGSDNAPLVMVSTGRTWLMGNTNIFGLTGDVNSYLRANVAEPFRFTLGGPRRLTASSMDEYRGTDTALARAGYLHRIAALPTGLGQGLYLFTGYEAGEIWSPEARAILRQDGDAGLLAATPVGTISIGGAVGDAGHRKFFFTVGRLF
jgi:NTE family protein